MTIFMQRMGNDRAALVGFAGSAFIAAPLTTDHRAIMSFLDPMNNSYISDQSTNLAVGVDACLKALGLESVKDRAEIADLAAKVIVIISDGEETGSDFRGAIARAENLGVPIYSFAVGTARGGPIPIRSERGVEYLKDPDNGGNNVITKLEEKRLKEMANKTGGKVFYLSSGVEILKDFEAALANYKRDSVDAGTRLDREDRFQWPLILAFLFLFLDFLIPERGFAFRKRARRGQSNLGVWIAGALVLLSSQGARANPAADSTLMPWTIFRNNRALALYRKQALPEARKSFEDALSDNSRHFVLRFNWAATRLAMALPQQQGQEINQKILDEVSGELKKLLKEYPVKAKEDAFLKGLHYQLALALELKKQKEEALIHYYSALHQGPVNDKLDASTEEGIRRLLAESPQSGGGGGGGGQGENPEPQDGQEPPKNPQYGQQQRKPEFQGTDIDQSQAQKILESVGSKEREVQKRRSQKEAQERQRERGKDGQSFGRGKQW